jgi:charged multivesicular body protein 3
MQFLFGKGGDDGAKKKDKNDPIQQGKEWKRNLQKEIRRIDRDIANIKRMEQKSMKECQALAKAGRISAVKILAKEVANTRVTIDRMHSTKAQLNSVCSQLQTSMSMVKMQGCLAKSAEIMHAMNDLVSTGCYSCCYFDGLLLLYCYCCTNTLANLVY